MSTLLARGFGRCPEAAVISCGARLEGYVSQVLFHSHGLTAPHREYVEQVAGVFIWTL